MEGINISNFDSYNNRNLEQHNQTFSINEFPLVKQPPHMIAVYSIAYGLVFLFGLLGNSFVIAVIIKDPGMRNVTNYFILNMAVADVLVALLVVPITLMANIFTGRLHVSSACASDSMCACLCYPSLDSPLSAIHVEVPGSLGEFGKISFFVMQFYFF